jgi:hypothetical protein
VLLCYSRRKTSSTSLWPAVTARRLPLANTTKQTAMTSTDRHRRRRNNVLKACPSNTWHTMMVLLHSLRQLPHMSVAGCILLHTRPTHWHTHWHTHLNQQAINPPANRLTNVMLLKCCAVRCMGPAQHAYSSWRQTWTASEQCLHITTVLCCKLRKAVNKATTCAALHAGVGCVCMLFARVLLQHDIDCNSRS